MDGMKRRGRHKALRFGFHPASRRGSATARARLVLRLKRGALNRARRASRKGGQIRAALFATAIDPSGNSASAELGLKIKRHRFRSD